MSDLLSYLAILSHNLAAFLLLGSILAVLIGRIFYGISIFRPIEELLYKQETYRREHELRKFNEIMANYYLELGNAFLDVCKLEYAKIEFEKARSLDPANIKVHIGLQKTEIFQPILKKDTGHYDFPRAIKMINVILKENPNDKHAYLFLAMLYLNKIDYKTASTYYEKVISLNPKSDANSLAYSDLAYIYTSQDKKEHALMCLEEAVNIYPWSSEVLNNLSYHYLIQGRYKEAIGHLRHLLQFNPYYIIAYWNIINAYRMIGNFEAAHDYNKKLIGCIDDEEVCSLDTAPYFFNTDDGGTYFKDNMEKKCYSYCSMALTCYLRGLETEAREFIDKAKILSPCDKTSTKNFVYFNVKSLQQANVTLTPKLEEFKELLQNLDYCNMREIPFKGIYFNYTDSQYTYE
jgi:tetratricopeptide (TPR) repeat protein